MTRRQPAVARQAASVFLSVPSRLTERMPQSLFVCILFYAPNTTTPLERHVHSKMTIQEYSIIITPEFQGILTFFQKHRQTAAPLRPFVFFLFQYSPKMGKVQERPAQKKEAADKSSAASPVCSGYVVQDSAAFCARMSFPTKRQGRKEARRLEIFSV